MRLKERHEDGVTIFALSGAIDLHYVPTLRSLFQSKLKERCPALIVDLSALDFIDSTGLATLIEYHRDAGMPQGHQVVDDEPGTLAVVADDGVDPGRPGHLSQRDERGRPGGLDDQPRTTPQQLPAPGPGPAGAGPLRAPRRRVQSRPETAATQATQARERPDALGARRR